MRPQCRPETTALLSERGALTRFQIHSFPSASSEACPHALTSFQAYFFPSACRAAFCLSCKCMSHLRVGVADARGSNHPCFSCSCVFQSCFGPVSNLFQTLHFGSSKSSIEAVILARSSSSSSSSSSSNRSSRSSNSKSSSSSRSSRSSSSSSCCCCCCC